MLGWPPRERSHKLGDVARHDEGTFERQGLAATIARPARPLDAASPSHCLDHTAGPSADCQDLDRLQPRHGEWENLHDRKPFTQPNQCLGSPGHRHEARSRRHPGLGRRAGQELLHPARLAARRRLRGERRFSGHPVHSTGFALLGPFRQGDHQGGARLGVRTSPSSPISRRLAPSWSPEASRRAKCSTNGSGRSPRAASIRSGGAMHPMPRSAIRTATAGCCRR